MYFPDALKNLNFPSKGLPARKEVIHEAMTLSLSSGWIKLNHCLFKPSPMGLPVNFCHFELRKLQSPFSSVVQITSGTRLVICLKRCSLSMITFAASVSSVTSTVKHLV